MLYLNFKLFLVIFRKILILQYLFLKQVILFWKFRTVKKHACGKGSFSRNIDLKTGHVFNIFHLTKRSHQDNTVNKRCCKKNCIHENRKNLPESVKCQKSKKGSPDHIRFAQKCTAEEVWVGTCNIILLILVLIILDFWIDPWSSSTTHPKYLSNHIPYWMAASVGTSRSPIFFFWPLIDRARESPCMYMQRMVHSAFIFSCQHWQVSPTVPPLECSKDTQARHQIVLSSFWDHWKLERATHSTK